MSVANPSLIDARASIPDVRRREASDRALHHFANLSDLTLSFAPIGSEIDLWPLNCLLAKKGILALPRVEGEDLICYRVNDLDSLIVSNWGIPEPDPEKCTLVSLEELHTILVPGLAFDARHHRKGYGKGYYDRFLQRNKRVRSICVGFRKQFSEIPLKTHEGDVSLDSLPLF